jgi:aldose 1-epimerase
MSRVILREGRLSAEVSTEFGAIWSFEAERRGRSVPLLRRPAADAPSVATASGCFPLIPFGNRVRGNHFRYDGRDYALAPNTDWDRHYLHGEGWLAAWEAERVTPNSIAMRFEVPAAAGTPYVYEGCQVVTLGDGRMTLEMSVTNRGSVALPFGLGWHPFFPMTPETTLRATADAYWVEGDGWLPTERRSPPEELDFNSPRRLPRHWVDNDFEGWDGRAEIVWPESEAALQLSADSAFDRYFVFVSDTGFDPAYRQDFFCFEPMTHTVDGHNLADGGGLRRLAPGETMKGALRLVPILG